MLNIGNNCLRCIIIKRFYKRFYSVSSTKTWKSVVGLEIHAQLNTLSKLFSGSKNKFGGAVNNCVSLFDAAIPGTLPVLNRKCVEFGIKTALALSCKVNEVSTFDRKHYFYADLPAGYQITQQRTPLAVDGKLDFQVFTPGIHKNPYKKSSTIKQIQLEQDSGKSLHVPELKKSLVDLNRAGAPLIEVVFEPDLEDGEEAAALVKELVLIVQRLGVCTGQMEQGALRVDANVSIHRLGEPLGTRTEIKNIGSVRGVARAIQYEIARQTELVEQGAQVYNETRAWDATIGQTVAMRDKEVVQDYRYMPEPNLPPLRVNVSTKENRQNIISVPQLLETLPELPEESRQRLIQFYDLKPDTAIKLVNEPILLEFFQQLAEKNPKNSIKIANLLLNELLTTLNKRNLNLEDCSLTITQLGEVTDLLIEKKISLDVCIKIFDELINSNKEICILELVKEKGWSLVSDKEEINKRCLEVIENNPKLVKLYRDGKVKVFKALIGILVKNTQTKLDMSLVAKVMEELLKKDK